MLLVCVCVCVCARVRACERVRVPKSLNQLASYLKIWYEMDLEATLSFSSWHAICNYYFADTSTCVVGALLAPVNVCS
jgi:hypothetical protein